MHTVTFYSYKGGVGRTLVVANVAKYVARLGMKVFVLDLDLEAPGLHYKFGKEDGKPLITKRGLVDILSTFTATRRLPEQLTDYVIEVESTAFAMKTIHLLPAGCAPSAQYWKSLTKIDWHALFYSEEPDGIPLFLELKAFIEATYTPDLLLIDARTGITEMGGIATTVLSDQVVCMMLPTHEHIDGTRGVMHAIRTAPRMEGASDIALLAVLSRLPHRSHADETAEVERVKALLNAPIDELGTSLRLEDIPILHREPALEERELILVGSSRGLDESVLLQDYVRLFAKLVPPREIELPVGKLAGNVEEHGAQAPDAEERKRAVRPEAHLSKLTPEAALALVRSAADGDLHAVRRLVTDLTPVIQAAVARVLSRASSPGRDARQEIEDAVQTVLLSLFADRGRMLLRWDPSRGLSLEGFVMVLARREMTSILRSRRRSPFTERPTLQEDLDQNFAQQMGIEADAISRDLVDALGKTLRSRLSPQGAGFFGMLFLQDLTVEEVCTATGLTPGAVESWRARLRRQARQILAEMGRGPSS